jgi:hypothetical protein
MEVMVYVKGLEWRRCCDGVLGIKIRVLNKISVAHGSNKEKMA